eukprot:CAMPEP_0185027944 /NCGR_PEP_ID=MMETSP1103-20130426/13296_1 /TAXON_ID=36769 /ORGANISM="Paraphysomonas bandaiensis, Strain Caron Lab Isolate" /LENGTH=951 /DNA_ID=CAMNT_0027562149 /DNA_START=320 /DNA_END=3172 /DNA_ORIENTATION=-
MSTEDGVNHELVFKNSYEDPSFSREKLAQDVVMNTDGMSIAVTHVNLYINGEYNGLYQMRETVEVKMLHRWFGKQPEVWYNVADQYGIDVITPAGEQFTTNLKKLERSDTSSKFELTKPLYDLSNKSVPMHAAVNLTSLNAVLISMKLLLITDVSVRNFFLAVDPDTSLIHTILWDADQTLGVHQNEGASIEVSPQLPYFKAVGRKLWPSSKEKIFSGTNAGRTEYDTYNDTVYRVMDKPDGALSVDSLKNFTETMRRALAPSAKKDADKWSRWYCAGRMDFDSAMEEMETVLLARRHNYLAGDTGDQIEGNFYKPYGCDDQYVGKADSGMLLFLTLVLCINSVAFLVPSSLPMSLVSKTEPISFKQLYSTILPSYMQDCKERLLMYDYWLNVCVALLLYFGYKVYAFYDVLDDSEILGNEYMADVKYIWIYFAVAINVTFLVRNNIFRVVMWIIIVVFTNIYTIIDLVEFVGAESDESSVNSKGISISVDNADYPAVFALFVAWRVTSQFVIMAYSLRIPSISREITLVLDAYDLGKGIVKASLLELSAVKIVKRDAVVPHLTSREGDLSGSNSCEHNQCEDDGISKEKPAEWNEAEETSLPDECCQDLEMCNYAVLGSDIPRENTLECEPTVKNSLANNAEQRAAYKKSMKSFMRLNMAVFIAICVAFIIYIGVKGKLKKVASDIFFSTFLSIAILINIRAFYSCCKWFWLFAYGFDTSALDIMFSSRDNDDTWSLSAVKTMPVVTRQTPFNYLLPFQALSTEKKVRAVDGWIKKFAHTYDGLLVFVLSAESFSHGGNSIETYSLAYAISLIYMIIYVLTYSSNNSWSWIMYGAKARIMDGYLGRENEIFGYMFDKYMLPVSAPLLLWLNGIAHGENEIIYLTWYIFMPIIIGDSFAEIVGGTWGKQRIKVFGMGEENKKSWEGTIAMFASSFIILVVVNIYAGLAWHW